MRQHFKVGIVMEKTEVCRNVKLTDSINVTELGFFDHLRLLLSRVSNSDEAELDARQQVTAEHMRRKAALENLFSNALKRMNEVGKSSVTLGVSSEFLPCLDEVIDKEYGMGRFYTFEVYKKNLPSTVKHKFTVVIRTKVS